LVSSRCTQPPRSATHPGGTGDGRCYLILGEDKCPLLRTAWPSRHAVSGGFPDLGMWWTLIHPLPVKPCESKGCVLCGGGNTGVVALSGLQASAPPACEPGQRRFPWEEGKAWRCEPWLAGSRARCRHPSCR